PHTSRSTLFPYTTLFRSWKSLPVSDLTTLLSKATIPLIVLPLVTFAIILAAQLVMVLWTSVLLVTHGMSPGSTWTNFNLFQQSLDRKSTRLNSSHEWISY